MKYVHAVVGAELIQTSDGRPDRERAGADHELVVVEPVRYPVLVSDGDALPGNVDRCRGGVQPQPHPGGFQVRVRSVGQVSPVLDFTGDVVGNAADGEVRIGVCDNNGDVAGVVELASAQRGRDTRIAATDGNQTHQDVAFTIGRRAPGCGTTTSPARSPASG